VIMNDDFPVISHNQRNISTLMIEVPGLNEVEANDLIDILEQSFSSPTFEILKRSDEATVVINAHRNPKFVEDVVRDILAKVLERYHDLPDEVKVTVRSESEESIHKQQRFRREGHHFEGASRIKMRRLSTCQKCEPLPAT